MPYNSETETFYQSPATVVDSTPDGDTVQEGFDDRLTPAMAGLYADLNLLKADGMISVGIPATTTARGIGRVATLADMEPGATVENGPAFIDATGGVITTTPTAHAVPQADPDGTLNNWSGARFATCETASATAEKVAALENFILKKGARIFVSFSNGNSSYGALTLNVNGTGAHSIYNELGAVSSTNIARLRPGIAHEFIFDGTKWTLQRSIASKVEIGSRTTTGSWSLNVENGIPVIIVASAVSADSAMGTFTLQSGSADAGNLPNALGYYAGADATACSLTIVPNSSTLVLNITTSLVKLRAYQ